MSDIVADLKQQLAAVEVELQANRKWTNDAHHVLMELYTLVQQLENLIQSYREHEAGSES